MSYGANVEVLTDCFPVLIVGLGSLKKNKVCQYFLMFKLATLIYIN